MKEIHFKKDSVEKTGSERKMAEAEEYEARRYKGALKKQHERRQQILKSGENSKFAKKMAPYYKIMNRFSLPLQALWLVSLTLSLKHCPDILQLQLGSI
mgnify:CR=1 FL=1